LTTGEFRLLEALVTSANRVLSRDYLFELTREGEFESFDRAIDVQIGRLRKKLKDDPRTPALIKTVRGVGYMFCGNVEHATK
jgi:two-component system OmpR family response regulator